MPARSDRHVDASPPETGLARPSAGIARQGHPGPRLEAANAVLAVEPLDLSLIDPESLVFGPAEAPVRKTSFEDVNADGALDLVAHFRVRDTGIAWGDTEACLRGSFALTEFVACDSIQTVPPG